MKTNGTLSEQVNELINQEKEIMNNDMTLALQLFGAEVDDNGKAVQGGKRGFRVITHTTETDSQGTEENESTISDKELFKSAWMEVKEFQRQMNVSDALAFHIKQSLKDQEMELVRKGLNADPEDHEEINNEIKEFRDLNSGCMIDLTDKDMNEYFVERELDESSPELLGFKFEAPTFSRLFDETEKEYVMFRKEKLEDRNWLHIKGMEAMREKRFNWLKARITASFEDAYAMNQLPTCQREEVRKLANLKYKINEARDYSFAHVLLDSLVPAMKGKAWRLKRDFYLKLDLKKKLGVKFSMNKHLRKEDIRIYNVYNESRGLTFEQQKELLFMVEFSLLAFTPKGK